MSLQKEIRPFFPLNLILLPGEETYLHLFEPRYKQLLQDCIRDQSPFVIPFSQNASMSEFGSLVRVEKVINTYSGGESDIVVRGIDIVRIEEYYDQVVGKMYPGGKYGVITPAINHIASKKLIDVFERFERERGLMLAGKGYDDALRVVDIARTLHMDVEQKLNFIEATPSHREDILVTQINFLRLLHAQEDQKFGEIYLN